MRIGYLAPWIMAAFFVTATSADAQRRPRTIDGGSSSSASSKAVLPPDAVKRTWDFTKRYGIINLGGRGGCGAEAQEAQANINTANQLLADFLAGPSDPKKLGLERRNYLKQVAGAERSIDSYLSTFQDIGKRGGESFVPPVEQDICAAKGKRMSMLALRDGLAGIAKIYPDMAEVGPVLARAEAALKTMGNDTAITSLIKSNRSASLASVRLKPALSSNPEWIAGFRSAFPQLVSGQTILKIHPYSSNWYVHKNEVTSNPEYRQIGAWIATKAGDGSCWIHSLDLWQNYVGTSFDRGQYKLGEPARQILCENV